MAVHMHNTPLGVNGSGLPSIARLGTDLLRFVGRLHAQSWSRLADPTFAAVERHRAATRAFDIAYDLGEGADPRAEGMEEMAAWDALLANRPTTLRGLQAVAAYVDRSIPLMDERRGEALGAVAAACRKLIGGAA